MIPKKSFMYLGAAISISVFVFVIVYFEPQALLIDEKSNESQRGSVITRETTASTESQVDETTTTQPTRSQWRSREHTTTGDVFLTEENNVKYVRFENLDTDNGPDLKVYIAKDVKSNGSPIEYVNLGDLRANIGDANYAVPSNVNIDDYKYVIIWCKRFSVSFADAEI